MDSNEVSKIIKAELNSYKYEAPESGTTYGAPWSEEKVMSYIPTLKKSLVTPTLQKFLLAETPNQFGKNIYAKYWLIARDKGYVQWYNPETSEYGLGTESKDGQFCSIGVKGDLLGVYCAM